MIVGLGNPGKKYINTRHNIGFMVVDRLAKKWKLSWKTDKKAATLRTLKFTESTENSKIILVKPMTFMNSSGLAVKKLTRRYSLDARRLFVIHDDLDIPLGEYKIQFGKGPKGHGGVNSIEQYLKTRDFWRIRIGIENRLKGLKSLKGLRREDYVLGKFGKEEKKVIDEVIKKIIDKAMSNESRRGIDMHAIPIETSG